MLSAMLKRLLLSILALAVASIASAQPPAPVQPSQENTVQQSNAPVDPALHEKALKLIELQGLRQKMQANLDKLVEQGKATMTSRFPGLDPRFVDEWGKRMRARVRIDDYIDIYVKAYEKYFTIDDMQELINAQIAVNDSKTAVLSQQLQEKLKTISPSMQSDILGLSTQIGSKLGAEIGVEIQNEHPEWFKAPKAGDAK